MNNSGRALPPFLFAASCVIMAGLMMPAQSPNRKGQPTQPPAVIGPKTRIETAAGIVIDTTTPNVIRLSIRETEDVFIAPDDTSTPPLIVTARNSFDPDSLHVIVNGEDWTRDQHFKIGPDNQTVTFLHTPPAANVVKLRYRY